MTRDSRIPVTELDEDTIFRRIVEGTANVTGQEFFRALAKNLAGVLGTNGAWVTEYFPKDRLLRALAFWVNGEFLEDYSYNIEGTLCEKAVRNQEVVFYPDRVLELTSQDFFGAVSYLGAPLMDVDGTVLGHLGAIDTRPMPEEPRVLEIFRIFAARAAAELQRLRADQDVREEREKLSSLIDSAMDAIVELDSSLRIMHINPAAEKLFECGEGEMVGSGFGDFLEREAKERLDNLLKTLEMLPEKQRHLWIPGGLKAVCAGGRSFTAEATISHFELHRQTYYTLILRDLRDRLEAERKIRTLTAETELLREEIQGLVNFSELIGESPPMLRVMKEVEQVANTPATVLITGETGTGKELIARAIHNASPRKDKPIVTVNCAAIPPTLMESEFFGHEKGAFTGATARREGRLSLADGGSIFLDEVGELPLDLQSKLLRVLQEGEFEPVGGTQTHQVDVRVISATNRNLTEEIRRGNFREDLYYRLHVFPIELPPLRERGNDVVALANFFVTRFAQRMGRTIEPLSREALKSLKEYPWPGNIRELQNVLERAVITAQGNKLNLNGLFPKSEETRSTSQSGNKPAPGPDRILTMAELQDLERRNLLLALEATGWRVAGKSGAARMLGINPFTLNSRMKKLNIQRPGQSPGQDQ